MAISTTFRRFDMDTTDRDDLMARVLKDGSEGTIIFALSLEQTV
jgi:hypothetical protein